MKKQYRYEEYTWCKVCLCLYHDGELVDSKKLWLDEADKAIEQLEANGYVYGYTKEEIKKAKEQYEEMLRNAI